jgi:hypothetical protein
MDSANTENLNRLLGRLETIRRVTGARQISLAGVLPSFLQRSDEHSHGGTSYTDHTPEAVYQAIRWVRKKHFHSVPHKVVLLGGAGRIGRHVRERLAGDGIETVVLDLVAVSVRELVPDTATGPILFVDMSRRDVIERYVHDLLPGSIVLNEVFPEPSRRVLESIKARNVPVIHISGVKTEVFPPLPFGYSGALPCCAIHSPASTELVLSQLS